MIFITKEGIMRRFIISEEDRQSILSQHVNEGHTVSENMKGVAFGDEINGLKMKKEEPTEGLSDMVSGLKGVWRGEGYDYFKYLNSLKRQMNSLQKLDKPNQKIMNELSSLKNKITSSKMPPQKRDNLIRTIDSAIGHFNSYTNLVQQIGALASQKLN